MREWQSLAHVKGECKYHVVIVPKYQRKVLFGHVRKRIGKIFRQLCRQKDIELVEGHALLEHVHMVLSIPPKLSVAMSRGYCVSTVGLDEQMIRAYVKNQEDLDRQEDLFNQ